MSSRELMIIRGLPGSGKSTLARRVCEESGAVHVETDMFWGPEYKFHTKLIRQAHEWCRAECTRLLYLHGSVVVSNTFTIMSEIIPYLQIARHLKARVVIVECKGEYGSVHDVPEGVLRSMRERWEPLTCFASLPEWRDVFHREGDLHVASSQS